MKADETAKNLLLNKTCDTCVFSREFCSDEYANKEITEKILRSYNGENTCEGWTRKLNSNDR